LSPKIIRRLTQSFLNCQGEKGEKANRNFETDSFG
jgi:hypothetical protein